MRSLSVQVQPNRAPGLNMDRVTEAFRNIALITDLVEHSHFDQGEDEGPYFNFTFGTSRAAELWLEIQVRIYRDQEIGPALQRTSIVTCSSERPAGFGVMGNEEVFSHASPMSGLSGE